MLHLTPAPEMPWPVASPFRMRPGLARLAAHEASAADTPALFLRDAQASAYADHKRAVLQQHHERGLIGEADPAVLRAIAEAYAAQTGTTLAPEAEAEALALGLQEDFVVLHDEPEIAPNPDFVRPPEGVQSSLGRPGERLAMRARFLSVCFPSNWSPAEKLGLDFTAIHAPVADNALLQAGGQGIIDMAFRQAGMLRHVWLLTANGDLPQHPETRRARWEDAIAQADASGQRLIDQTFFRVERQTTLPLPALRRGVFFIRVLVCPLVDVLRVQPGRAAQLAEALASMSDAVVAYRGMAAVRPRLLDELART